MLNIYLIFTVYVLRHYNNNNNAKQLKFSFIRNILIFTLNQYRLHYSARETVN